MCPQCVREINRSFTFKKKCERSEKSLRETLSRTETLNIEYCSNDNEDLNEKSDNVSESDSEKSDSDNKINNCVDDSENVQVTSEFLLKKDCSKVVENVKVSTCSLCGQAFTEGNEETHIELCHNGDFHSCITCKKKYKDLKALKRHLRIHK